MMVWFMKKNPAQQCPWRLATPLVEAAGTHGFGPAQPVRLYQRSQSRVRATNKRWGPMLYLNEIRI